MEPEEKYEGLAKYDERWNGETLEVKDKNVRQKSFLTMLSSSNLQKDRSNAILITEEKVRYLRKGKKRIRPLTRFLKDPGNMEEVLVSPGNLSYIWLNKEMFMRITKRNNYIDNHYIK